MGRWGPSLKKLHLADTLQVVIDIFRLFALRREACSDRFSWWPTLPASATFYSIAYMLRGMLRRMHMRGM